MECPLVLESILKHLTQTERARVGLVSKSWKSQAHDPYYIGRVVIHGHKLESYSSWFKQIGAQAKIQQICFVGVFNYTKFNEDSNDEHLLSNFNSIVCWLKHHGLQFQYVEHLCIFHTEVINFEAISTAFPNLKILKIRRPKVLTKVSAIERFQRLEKLVITCDDVRSKSIKTKDLAVIKTNAVTSVNNLDMYYSLVPLMPNVCFST